MPQIVTLELINAIIYKIENKAKTVCYIGCTTQPLQRRWASHKYDALSGRGGCAIHKHMRAHNIEDFEITVIEVLEGVTRREMHTRETFWITQVVCVNEKRSYVSEDEKREQGREYNRDYYQANRERLMEKDHEYKQANREMLKEKAHAYYQANREAINEKAREKAKTRLMCQCGIEYSYSHKSRHIKSQLHKDWIYDQQQAEQSERDLMSAEDQQA